ncbi:triose-phosphate transporter family-domain-containing protein [Kockiozyma suomiensis]|uniref:triose-phosphate transporter family-domain-containing protein n=1 Tax=Kockiozyma suomiensis TaxID=1337062 RepID=UPI003343A90C
MHRRASFVETSFHQLAPPISVKLIILSLAWYWSSAVSNTLTKSILNVFPYPITLSMLQFGFVVAWALVTSSLTRSPLPGMKRLLPFSHSGITRPTRVVVLSVAPMAVFQLSGHIFSHIATSKIPVSLVHTIKGLSPLFTVFAYRFIFGVHYSFYTYLSLVPLTLGVMLACSFEFQGQLIGILCALLAAIIFVSQNIFSKKLLTASPVSEGDPKRKLDKINLLCYCSGMAFILTSPLWFYYEGSSLLRQYISTGTLPIQAEGLGVAMTESTLGLLFFLNGTVHYGQNFLAFQILGMVSPVTYSIASLFKRVFVIIVAILWFGQELSAMQNWGIALTFLGLYMYDRAGDVSRKERHALGIASPLRVLPVTSDDVKEIATVSSRPSWSNASSARNSNELHVRPTMDSIEKDAMMHSLHLNNASSTVLVA